MKAYAPIIVVVALLAVVPFMVTSNVVLNFLVMALLIALAGQVLGGGADTLGFLTAAAGLGALAGTAVGAREADKTGRTIQRRYDIAYEQCMYSRGNVLPGQSASRYPGIP